MTNGSTTWEHTYNADGLRTKRTDGTDTYEYVYLDGQLVQLTVNDNGTEVLMKFAYDADGVPLSITYKGIIYYYVTNLLGDVVGIVNQSGNLLVSYTYDAWGNILSTTGSNANALGKHNPLRYRGYVYDEGTGLYYLQSRYYDPEMGRFLNADETSYLGIDGALISYNLFAYCKNNPVMYSDSNGHFGLIAAIITTGAIVGGVLGAFSAATTGGNVLESTIEGIFTGALGAACGILISNPIVAVALATAGGAAIDFTTQIVSQCIETNTIDVSKVDPGRIVKTGLQTGIGTAIPAFGEGAGNAVDAFGTALIWAETSTAITCTDVVTTNIIATVQSPSMSEQSLWYNGPVYDYAQGRLLS